MTSVLTEPVGPFAPGTPELALVEYARDWMNGAYAAVKLPGGADVASARDSLAQARSSLAYLAARDGADDACAAARLLLPRLDRASALLEQLGLPTHAGREHDLLREFDAAMDHMEELLAAAGWD